MVRLNESCATKEPKTLGLSYPIEDNRLMAHAMTNYWPRCRMTMVTSATNLDSCGPAIQPTPQITCTPRLYAPETPRSHDTHTPTFNSGPYRHCILTIKEGCCESVTDVRRDEHDVTGTPSRAPTRCIAVIRCPTLPYRVTSSLTIHFQYKRVLS